MARHNIFIWQTAVKTILALSLCMFAASAFASGGQTWYCTKDDTAKDNKTFTDPSYWHLADGTVMTEFSSEDEYYACNTMYASGSPMFRVGPLHLGSVAEGKSSYITIYSGNINHSPSGSDTVTYFEKGSITCNRYNDGVSSSAHTFGGTVHVASTKSNPFKVLYKYGNTTFYVTGAVNGGVENAILFNGGAMVGAACRFTDVSNYSGLITVTSTVENTSSTFGTKIQFIGTSFPGSLDLSRGTVLQMYSDAGSAAMTISNMTFRAGSRIILNGTAAAHDTFSATGSVTAEPGVEIVLNFAVPISHETNTVVLLSAPVGGANFTKDDFVLDASKSDWKQVYYLDTVVENGVKSLVAVFEPLVQHINPYGYEYEFRNDAAYRPSSMTNETHWTDNKVPHGGVRYFTKANLRTPYETSTPGVFPGLSLILEGGSLRVFNSEYTVTNLIVSGGTIQYGNQGTTTKPFYSKMISLRDGKTLTFETYLGHGIDIDSEISGDGRLWFSGIRREATSSPSAHYVLRKQNADFVGTVCVSQFIGGTYSDFSSKFQTLRIAHGKCLGGRMPEFEPAALTLAKFSRLQTISPRVELEDGLNRGVYIQGCGRFFVDKTDDVENTLVCHWPITMNGSLYKEGVGRLELGGTVSFQGEDAIGDTPREGANEFFVSAGSLAPRRYNCCDGMAMSFAKGTKLVVPVDPSNADLTKYGLYNVKEGGSVSIAETLAVEFDTTASPEPPALDFTVGLVTVTNTVAATEAVRGKLKLASRPYKGYRVMLVETPDAERGAVIFAARVKQSGFVLLVR